jgi:hypothetical protein
VGVNGDHPPGDAPGAGVAQWADTARSAEPSPPTTATGWDDRDGDPRRTGHRPRLEVDADLVFGEPPARCGRELGLDHRGEPVGVQPGEVSAAAVGGIAVDHPAGDRLALAQDQLAEQRGRDRGVAAGGRADSAAQMTSESRSMATWALPVGHPPVNWGGLCVLPGSSSAAHATARSRSQRRPHGAVPQGPERSGGRCRRQGLAPLAWEERRSHCASGDPRQAQQATAGWRQITNASSSNATTTRRVTGASTAAVASGGRGRPQPGCWRTARCGATPPAATLPRRPGRSAPDRSRPRSVWSSSCR